MEKTLIILRGVSGAGKSTVAETIAGKAWPVFEADKYHYRDGVYDWKPENMAVAHKWCQEQVREAMVCRIAKNYRIQHFDNREGTKTLNCPC